MFQQRKDILFEQAKEAKRRNVSEEVESENDSEDYEQWDVRHKVSNHVSLSWLLRETATPGTHTQPADAQGSNTLQQFHTDDTHTHTTYSHPLCIVQWATHTTEHSQCTTIYSTYTTYNSKKQPPHLGQIVKALYERGRYAHAMCTLHRGGHNTLFQRQIVRNNALQSG